MTKPKLYVELSGPLLIPSNNSIDPVFESHELAAYAKPFMHWATDKFDVQWLTVHSPHDAFAVARKLSLPAEKIPYRGFIDSKTEVLTPHENFYWVDGELIPSEVAWLAQHGHAGRLLQVDPHKGVTPELKERLEALIKKG